MRKNQQFYHTVYLFVTSAVRQIWSASSSDDVVRINKITSENLFYYIKHTYDVLTAKQAAFLYSELFANCDSDASFLLQDKGRIIEFLEHEDRTHNNETA